MNVQSVSSIGYEWVAAILLVSVLILCAGLFIFTKNNHLGTIITVVATLLAAVLTSNLTAQREKASFQREVERRDEEQLARELRDEKKQQEELARQRENDRSVFDRAMQNQHSEHLAALKEQVGAILASQMELQRQTLEKDAQLRLAVIRAGAYERLFQSWGSVQAAFDALQMHNLPFFGTHTSPFELQKQAVASILQLQRDIESYAPLARLWSSRDDADACNGVRASLSALTQGLDLTNPDTLQKRFGKMRGNIGDCITSLQADMALALEWTSKYAGGTNNPY